LCPVIFFKKSPRIKSSDATTQNLKPLLLRCTQIHPAESVHPPLPPRPATTTRCHSTTGFKNFFILITLLTSAATARCDNKIVIEDFKWSVATSSAGNNIVDIHHYPSAEPLLDDITKILSDSYKRTSYLKKEPSSPVPFFIYISQNDFEQSLIADVSEGTGGVTEAFKNRFIVGHTGSMRYLNHVISHEYTHVIENEILFGGWWKSARLLKFTFYPLWLMEGLAEYSSGDLDIPEREMRVRDAVLNQKLPSLRHLHNFAHLEPNNVVLAYKTSEMLMRFIAREYGEDKLYRLIDVYKNNYDASTVIESVLGLKSSEDLDFRFREWCRELYEETFRDRNRPEGEYVMPPERRTGFGKNFSNDIRAPLILPDGKIAYISDRRGANEIWLYDPVKKKEKILVGAGNNLLIDYISTDGRALSISPDGKYLAFVGEKNKKDFIALYNIISSAITIYHPPIENLKSISSPSFFPDGKKIIFSAMKGCFRDLYIYNTDNNTITQLTNDNFDDTDPVVTPDGKYIIYASERQKEQNSWDYDLFAMDISGASVKIARLTDWEWDERTPVISGSGKTLVFRAEPDEIRNIYIIKNFDEVIRNIFNSSYPDTVGSTANYIRLTDTSGGCFDPYITDDENEILYSLYLNGTMEILRIRCDEKSTPPPPTPAKSSFLHNEDNKPVIENTIPPPAEEKKYARASETMLIRHPYVFTASTDLFFPFIYYSSLDGLFLASYWQFSDMLSRHNTQIGLLYSEYNKRLNYLWQYTYSRYRTDIFLSASGDNIYYNYTMDDYTRYDDFIAGISYPFDRYRRTEISARTIFYKDFINDAGGSLTTHRREDYLNLYYIKDTSIRKYLETTGGDYLKTGITAGIGNLGGSVRRTNFSFEYKHWFELNPSLILYSRIYGAAFLEGKDPLIYYISGGEDERRVRGYPYKDEYTSDKIITATLAARVPIVGNINYYMWYLFPDFYFKTLTGEFFIDAGAGEHNPYSADNNNENPPTLSSFGASLKLYTFILQSYPLIFKVEWAKPFADEKDRWYFKITSYLPD